MKELKERLFGVYVDEGGVEEDACTVVEDVDDGFEDSREAFDGFFDGSSAGGAGHAEDGEKGGEFRALDGGGGSGIALGVAGHGGVVRLR